MTHGSLGKIKININIELKLMKNGKKYLRWTSGDQ